MSQTQLDRLTNPIRRGGAIIITSQCIVSCRTVSVPYLYRIRIVSYRLTRHCIVSRRIAIVIAIAIAIVSYHAVFVSYSYRIRIVPRTIVLHCIVSHRIVSYPYRVVSVSSRLHVSTSPHHPASASPRLHVPTSSRLRFPASPRLHVPASPRLHVSPSPRLHVTTSPRLHLFTSPCLQIRKLLMVTRQVLRTLHYSVVIHDRLENYQDHKIINTSTLALAIHIV